MDDDRQRRDGLVKAEDLLPELARKIRDSGPTPIQQRLMNAAEATASAEQRELLYQHTVFCQTSLPYRDPGDLRTWERENGAVRLEVNAGKAMHPVEGRFVELGLPFGPKARMILMHINQQALRSQSPEIDIQDTLSKFVRRTLNLDPHGRNMRIVKDQLGRLSASSIRLGVVRNGHALTVNSQIITAFDVWFPKDDRQRILWPSTVKLSLDYWESLKIHAVPLDEVAIAGLSHSSMGLDIYAWLAQRLHRIDPNKPQHITWESLHRQFGQGYDPEWIENFRRTFRVALKQVKQVYREARVAEGRQPAPQRVILAGKLAWREPPAKGLVLRHSPPPVAGRR